MVAGLFRMGAEPGAAAAATGTVGSVPTLYRIAPGDTLWSIAQRLGTTVAALVRANAIRDANFIEAGATLVVVRSIPASSGRPGLTGSSGPGAMPAGLRRHSGRLVLVPDFQRAAAAAGVPLSLLEAICWQESGWQSGVVSAAGASGIGQLIPATVAFVNSQISPTRLDAARPADNIAISAWFLRYLLDRTGWDPRLAVGAYYQGLASVRAHGLFAETRHYVANVFALQGQFQG